MTIEKLLSPIRRRIENMVARGVLRIIAAGGGMQTAQIEVGALGEVRGPLEHFQPYGFTSNPKPGAEAITVFAGGSRDHGLVLVIDDRRYRLKQLASGEVALYTDEAGNKIHFKRGGIVQVFATVKVEVEAPDVTVTAINNVILTGGGTVKGVVQGDCVCAFTGGLHPQTSVKIKGSL